ncbi:hypothetical protein A1WO_00002 [Escherichia coli KTE102]|nr:hypothetical protein A1WO_00002 [Escherichia coli KTE102]
MPFLIGLFSPILTQGMCSLNALLLTLAAAKPVLMRHRGHQVDKHVIVNATMFDRNGQTSWR